MGNSRMFWRLFVAYGLLMAAALGVLGWMLMRRVEAHLTEELRQNLEMKAVLVRACADTLPTEDQQRFIARLGKETHARITLIDEDGQVLVDSEKDSREMANHSDRPEIEQAKKVGKGSATRYSHSLGEWMMYVALPVPAPTKRGVGPPEALPVQRYVRLALPLSAVNSEVRWLQGAVWTAVGTTLVLALLLTMILAQRICAPLVELADAARSVAKGEYGKSVRVRTRDEIGSVGAAFNDMSKACATHIAQMEQDRQRLLTIFRSMEEGVLVIDAEQRVEFVNDAAGRLLGLPLESIRHRKLSSLVRQPQLDQAVQKVLASDEPHHCELELQGFGRKVLVFHGSRLPGTPLHGAVLVLHDITQQRQLERVRQDFVANVSHELKTPLAAIQAVAETLLDGAIHDPHHNVRFVERIRENADRLHCLVQDLLTLGRIESGKEGLELQPVSVAAAVAACVSRQEQRALAKQLALEQQPPMAPVTILADGDAVAQILDNLLDNAVKYTPEGGRIILRWFQEGELAVIQVQDTGMGIPEKDLPRIFERFYRVDKARSRELGGTGLGLSIVKHLVQSLNGTVAASSQPGAGTIFTVRLPIAKSVTGQRLLPPENLNPQAVGVVDDELHDGPPERSWEP